MIDAVIPTKNEESFVSMAKELGFKALCFLYQEKDYEKAILPKSNDIKLFKGLLLKKAERKKLSEIPFILVEDNDIKLMKRYADGIMHIELGKDYMHQRGSGLDHIMCRSMAQHTIGYCITLAALRDDKGKKIGKVMQNVRLCQKYGVPMMLFSLAADPYDMRAPADLRSFGSVLGMHPSIAKKAVEHAFSVLKDHTDPKRLAKGIYAAKE